MHSTHRSLLQEGHFRARVATWLLESVEIERFRGVAKLTESDGWAIPFDHNGDCVFLKNDRCSIYEERPVACRTFNCLAGYEAHGPGRHSFFLQDSPDVLRLAQVTLATM
jgi:Fe-S-cluster containining protein